MGDSSLQSISISMSESREPSFESSLAGFQDTIRSFIEKRGKTDGTIVGIIDVKELGGEEKESWNTYEQILKEAIGENANYSDVSKKALNLGRESHIRLIDAEKNNRISTCCFYAWLNNRIAVISFNAQYLVDSPAAVSEVVPELKSELNEFFGV